MSVRERWEIALVVEVKASSNPTHDRYQEDPMLECSNYDEKWVAEDAPFVVAAVRPGHDRRRGR